MSPATQPSRFERVIRRAVRATIRTARVPTIADMKRQPNVLVKLGSPQIHSPSAIIHLPSGGCTM